VRVVEAALEDLDPRERAAVLLRVTGGLHYREVGEALGLTDRGAARVVASALERLRRLLGRPGAADARESERRNACEPARP
jgi:RNA polymerase sigma factor (sigma-70 family)